MNHNHCVESFLTISRMDPGNTHASAASETVYQKIRVNLPRPLRKRDEPRGVHSVEIVGYDTTGVWSLNHFGGDLERSVSYDEMIDIVLKDAPRTRSRRERAGNAIIVDVTWSMPLSRLFRTSYVPWSEWLEHAELGSGFESYEYSSFAMVKKEVLDRHLVPGTRALPRFLLPSEGGTSPPRHRRRRRRLILTGMGRRYEAEYDDSDGEPRGVIPRHVVTHDDDDDEDGADHRRHNEVRESLREAVRRVTDAVLEEGRDGVRGMMREIGAIRHETVAVPPSPEVVYQGGEDDHHDSMDISVDAEGERRCQCCAGCTDPEHIPEHRQRPIGAGDPRDAYDSDMDTASDFDETAVFRCNICFCDFTTPIELNDTTTVMPQSLGDVIIVPPCGHMGHATCALCLGRYMTQWYNHPIGPRSGPVLRCVHDGCNAHWPNLDLFRHILCAEEHARLKEHAEKFANSHQLTARCGACGKDCVMARSRETQNLAPGEFVLDCEHCDTKFCYHCERSDTITSLYPDPEPYTACCAECLTLPSYTRRPGCFNPFYVPDTKYKDLLRNREITVDMAVKYIRDLMGMESGEAPLTCRFCLTQLHRTDGCCRVEHCASEQCWMCGMNCLPHETMLPSTHYDGPNVCPMFPSARYWARYGQEFSFEHLDEFPEAGTMRMPALCDNLRCHSHDACDAPGHRRATAVQSSIRRDLRIMGFANSLTATQWYKLRNALEEHERRDLLQMFRRHATGVIKLQE